MRARAPLFVAVLATIACGRPAIPRACEAGLVVIDGACLARDEGPAIPARCAPGDAIDPRRGACVPALAVRAIVARDRAIADDEIPGCAQGELVADEDHVACVAPEVLAPRAPSRCLPGAVLAGGACVEVVRAAGNDRVVDVATWARAVLGDAPGGADPHVCRPLGRRPWLFGIGPGGERTIAIDAELVFPDNDVTMLWAKVATRDESTGSPLASDPAAVAERALDDALRPLRALGGTSDAATLRVRVRCRIHGGAEPKLLPR